MEKTFQDQIEERFAAFIKEQRSLYKAENCIQMDLHCHDTNSNVPDEMLFRLMNVPETWLQTDDLIERLANRGQQVFTITNHNNARSCFNLLDSGLDILVGAEFTVKIPISNISVHVLAYGFSPAEEAVLAEKRHDMFDFIDYANSRDIATILAHPLFFHDPDKAASPEYLELMTLLFDNFEVVNGQRDNWQSLIMVDWLQRLTPGKIDALAQKHGINPNDYSRRPYQKAMTGGSDCHMGLFAGSTGTRFHIPDLQQRLNEQQRSELILEALQKGDTSVFGGYSGPEKTTAAFLSFLCQLSMHMEDPGLVRMALHKGSNRQKVIAYGISNAVMELRRHKYTSRFLRTFQGALDGKRPGFFIKHITKKDYRPLLSSIGKIADARNENYDAFVHELAQQIPSMFTHLVELLSRRLNNKLEGADKKKHPERFMPSSMRDLEVSVHIRELFAHASKQNNQVMPEPETTGMDMNNMLDGLTFPSMASFLLLGSHFASTRVQFDNRGFLTELSRYMDRPTMPDKIMWLSDTYYDKNGVANSLQLRRKATLEMGLPIHFVVSADESHSDERITAFDTTFSMEVPFYKGFVLRSIDIMKLDHMFLRGSFNRIVISTEGPMGVAALYLKMAYSVPCYLFMHTDWLEYAKQSLRFKEASAEHLRRIMRWVYKRFDGIFVLNSEQAEWLASDEIGIEPEKIHLTAHWVNPKFYARTVDRQKVLPEVGANDRVMLYAGRVSREKGILDLPQVYQAAKDAVGDNVKLVVVGEGPHLDELQGIMPDAIFKGWVEKDQLSEIYCAADLLLFPSTFDTFGNTVLEAHASGTPAIAYNTKGPKDIILNEQTGFLVETQEDMNAAAVRILQDDVLFRSMKTAAEKRASDFSQEKIMNRMLTDMGL